jgi:hypothetical protein
MSCTEVMSPHEHVTTSTKTEALHERATNGTEITAPDGHVRIHTDVPAEVEICHGMRWAPGEREMHELANRIAELAAHIHAATYRLLVLVLEFDRKNGWEGWKTCAQWLSWRTGIGLEAAREKVRVARALPALPEISAAFERGEISYSKVRAMTRIATPETEDQLLQIAIHGTASQVEKVVRGYRRVKLNEEMARADERHERRYLGIRHDEHGNVIIQGRLPADLGARFLTALDAAVAEVDDGDSRRRKEREERARRLARHYEFGEPLDAPTARTDEAVELDEDDESLPSACESDRATIGQRRADALVLLADSAVAAKLSGRPVADSHQIVVHVDAEVLADPGADGRSELDDGSHVSAETSRRLACDAGVVTLREDECGEPLSIGRRRRTVPPAIRRALNSRDPGCRFPGCHHTRFLQAHHIRHWADGGETSLENLVNLCPFHHRALHEGGFRIEREAGGEIRAVSRSGSALLDTPPPSPPGSLSELMAAQRELEIRAEALPLWNGDPIDYGIAVSALLYRTEEKELSASSGG